MQVYMSFRTNESDRRKYMTDSPSTSDHVASLLFDLQVFIDAHRGQSMVRLKNLRLESLTVTSTSREDRKWAEGLQRRKSMVSNLLSVRSMNTAPFRQSLVMAPFHLDLLVVRGRPVSTYRRCRVI